MRIYLIGPPEVGDEYVTTKATLERQGHTVECHPEQDPDLRVAIGVLITCDAVCLMDTYWSCSQAMALSYIAAWLFMKCVDQDGEIIPTSSLRG